MKRQTKNQYSGQTLVEVIIMVAVVIMMVTGLVAGTVAALKSTNYSSAKSQGTKFAQEGMELVRKDRDASWSTFKNRAGKNYCIDQSGVFTQSNLCNPNLTNSGISYTRSAQFSWNNATQEMTVTIFITWPDGSSTRTSQITSIFTQWR